MTDLAAASISRSTSAPAHVDHAKVARIWSYIAIALAVAIVVAANIAAFVMPLQAGWILRVALVVMVATLCAAVATRQHRHWIAPVHQLEALVKQIRLGHAPIEELNGIAGGLSPVAELFKSVLTEIRSNEMALKELQQEIRQKVANRTEALERTVQSLRHQATRDPLTGLYNRRMLDQFLPRLVSKSLAENADLSAVMIDVDHFKGLNDTLGHAAGDDMLRSIGQLIHSAIRDTDMGFRCGGDEFVIILPGCDRAHAENLARRLGSLVDSLSGTLKVAKPPKLSIGVSSLQEIDPQTPEELLRHGDEALYAIKAARKNVSVR